MSRRYYSHKSIFKLSKTERHAYKFLVEMIKILIYIVTGVCEGVYRLGKYIGKIFINYYKLKEIGYDLNEIMDLLYNKISSRQFEVFTAELFKQHGNRVKLTAPTSDYGRDVIVNDNIFIECKHYSKDNCIGREICQKLLGSVQMFHAKKAIIITTGKYHKNAYEVASMVDNLELMDITDIQKMLFDLKPDQISKVIMRTLNAS